MSDDHALLAGHLDWSHRDPFDRMLAAQAMIESMAIITGDPALVGSPGVPTTARQGRGVTVSLASMSARGSTLPPTWTTSSSRGPRPAACPRRLHRGVEEVRPKWVSRPGAVRDCLQLRTRKTSATRRQAHAYAV